MKIITIVPVVIVVLAILVFIIVQWRKPAAELTAGESRIRDLVREVYAGNIVSEQVERRGSDAVLVAKLRNEKLKALQINLSSLARKHEQEGISLPVLKMSLRFD